MRKLRLSSDTIVHSMVEGSLHCFIQLDVGLSSRPELAHSSNIVLEEVLVKGVRNLQPVDECECRDILTAVGDFGELALEEADV